MEEENQNLNPNGDERQSDPKRQKMTMTMTTTPLLHNGIPITAGISSCSHSLMESESDKKVLARCCHNYFLPDELWVEIMSWLPVKSLFSCKCVQKSWRHLINTLIHDQTFVTKHLLNNNSTTATPSLFITCCHGDFRKAQNSFLTITCNEKEDARHTDHLETIIRDFDLSILGQQQKYLLSLPGAYCNGILCIPIFRQNNNILLCNPALREFKLIIGSCFGHWRRIERKRILGFGHDSIDNVYKVVRVACESGLLGAEIHTLGVDRYDSWRRINIDLPEFYTSRTPPLMCQELQCKRIIYWFASGCYNGKPVILSFDLHVEKFQTISLPSLDDDLSTTETCSVIRYKLALWKESVALFKFHAPRCRCGKRSTCISPKPIEMWVMDESSKGPEERYFWTKHLTIPPPLKQFCCPEIFWKDDELILMSYSHSTDRSRRVPLVSVYNLSTQKVKSLHGIPENLYEIGSFAFVESLVSVSHDSALAKEQLG
ncbi:F-box domain containing protein [Parasponia andersonii]|uniref:F-box domain containing protein n=1 Tax=Parasponia andersonii TaxID=3476 RepID=A0A2P5CHY5_PARAD|nr:F-box domain containing protein [Parasponia andersonii]